MDPFVINLMEKVFEKAEKDGYVDKEAKELMQEIRQKANNTPRHQRVSTTTEEFLQNIRERLVDEYSQDDMAKAIENYAVIQQISPEIKSVCGK